MEVMSLVLSSLISILGFWITYKNMKKTFEYETISKKNSIQLKQATDLPYEVLNLLNNILSEVVREKNQNKRKQNEKQLSKKFQEIQARVYSYGSLDAIKIFSKIQEMSFQKEKNGSLDNRDIVLLYSLLVSQLKYDITGEVISPEYWFKMTQKDYIQEKPYYQSIINEVIEKLDLNEKFIF